MIVELTIIFAFTLAFGWLSRVCGGAPPDLPFGLDQWLYAIPYGMVSWLAMSVAGFDAVWVVLGTLLSYLGAFLGKRTGHGQWMDLGNSTKIIEPERLDFIVEEVWGRDPNEDEVGPGCYWRDWFGLSISGLAVGLISSICLAISGYFILASVVALGAFCKGFAYSIGWLVFNEHPNPYAYKELDEATEVGELLTGIFGGLPLIIAILHLSPVFFN